MRIGKFGIPPHIVVPDANCLYSRKPIQIVSPGFRARWADCAKLTTLSLFIPEVVKHELIFQQVCLAKEACENAQKNLRTIAEVTQTPAPDLKSDDQLQSDVEATFESWRNTTAAQVIELPVHGIDWKSLVHDALWRRPPFTYPNQPGDDTEKGFRDALILQTLYHVWHQHPGDYVVFLSNDNRACEAASPYAARNDKHLILPSLDDLLSRLNLVQEEKSVEFANAVTQRAPFIFYTANDPECIYYKFKIVSMIHKEHGPALMLAATPPPQPRLPIAPPAPYAGIQPPKPWKPLSPDKIFIGGTRFVPADNHPRYFWNTRVTLARLFVQPAPPPVQPIFPPQRRIRIAKFDVLWSATVAPDAHFTDPEYVRTDSVATDFETPTTEKCTQYNLSEELAAGIWATGPTSTT